MPLLARDVECVPSATSVAHSPKHRAAVGESRETSAGGLGPTHKRKTVSNEMSETANAFERGCYALKCLRIASTT